MITAQEFAAALREYGGIAAACEALGMGRSTVYQRADIKEAIAAWQAERVPQMPSLATLRADVARAANAPPHELQAACLRLALYEYGGVVPAAAALGMSRQAIHQRADLRAVVAAWRLHDQSRADTTLCVRPEVTARFRAAKNKSKAVRDAIRQALRGRLPAPDYDATGERFCVGLGGTHAALAARLGTTDARHIAGVIRAILAAHKFDMPNA